MGPTLQGILGFLLFGVGLVLMAHNLRWRLQARRVTGILMSLHPITCVFHGALYGYRDVLGRPRQGIVLVPAIARADHPTGALVRLLVSPHPPEQLREADALFREMLSGTCVLTGLVTLWALGLLQSQRLPVLAVFIGAMVLGADLPFERARVLTATEREPSDTRLTEAVLSKRWLDVWWCLTQVPCASGEPPPAQLGVPVALSFVPPPPDPAEPADDSGLRSRRRRYARAALVLGVTCGLLLWASWRSAADHLLLAGMLTEIGVYFGGALLTILTVELGLILELSVRLRRYFTSRRKGASVQPLTVRPWLQWGNVLWAVIVTMAATGNGLLLIRLLKWI